MRTSTLIGLLCLLLAGCAGSTDLGWQGNESTRFSADPDWRGLALIQQLRSSRNDGSGGITLQDPCNPCKSRCYTEAEIQCLIEMLKRLEDARGCDDAEAQPLQMGSLELKTLGFDQAEDGRVSITEDTLRKLLEDTPMPRVEDAPPSPPISQARFPAPAPTRCEQLVPAGSSWTVCRKDPQCVT